MLNARLSFQKSFKTVYRSPFTHIDCVHSSSIKMSKNGMDNYLVSALRFVHVDPIWTLDKLSASLSAAIGTIAAIATRLFLS